MSGRVNQVGESSGYSSQASADDSADAFDVIWKLLGTADYTFNEPIH
jgi:hypothetical protein